MSVVVLSVLRASEEVNGVRRGVGDRQASKEWQPSTGLGGVVARVAKRRRRRAMAAPVSTVACQLYAGSAHSGLPRVSPSAGLEYSRLVGRLPGMRRDSAIKRALKLRDQRASASSRHLSQLVRIPRRCSHRCAGRSRNSNDIKFVSDQARFRMAARGTFNQLILEHPDHGRMGNCFSFGIIQHEGPLHLLRGSLDHVHTDPMLMAMLLFVEIHPDVCSHCLEGGAPPQLPEPSGYDDLLRFASISTRRRSLRIPRWCAIWIDFASSKRRDPSRVLAATR